MSLLPNLDQMTDNEKLAVLESIQKSIAESKEIQKKKIGENVDLVVQALKKIESDIRDRFDAVGNSIEKRVLSIQDGRDGANGKDGRDGKDGKSGRDGLKGDRGVDGQAGRDGVDGVDGISVVNAQIDFDGSLVITLSDGRELNVGEVVSQDIAEKIKVISTMSTNGAVGIKDEGTSISTGVKTINFVGAVVTATSSGDDVTVNVSSGTGTVTSVAATGGTGISVSGSPITTSGTLNITNTAPDQTVALTASTGISTSGTYPNFTITNSAPDQTVALTQGGTTTITGTYPNFTISSADQYQGTVTSVAATVPAFLSVTGSPVTSTGTLAIGLSGTALPVANGGTGITAFGTGVATALGVNTGSSGAFVVNGGALGTPSSGTVTNLTGTASININGTVGATTAAAGTFTTATANTSVTTPIVTSAAATTLTLKSAGTTAITIDTSQNVGIGTASPTEKLTVNGCALVQGALSALRASSLALDFNGGVARLIGTGADASTYASIAFGNATTTTYAEGMRLTTTGLGIGTSSPAQKLHIQQTSAAASLTQLVLQNADNTAGTGSAIGFANHTSSGLLTGKLESAIDGANAYSLRFYTYQSGLNERMRIDASGNVGIGTTSISNKLEVNGSVNLANGSNYGWGNQQTAIQGSTATNVMQFYTAAVLRLSIDGSGGLILAGSTAQKATGTTWSNPSDQRLKDNIRDYAKGTSELMQVRVREWEYNGKGGTVEGTKGLGVVADEVMVILPNTVENYDAKLNSDDEKVTAIKKFDATEITWLLVKTVQEQQALITALTARITALEAK